MSDVFEQMKAELQESLEDMPVEARDFALLLANSYLLMEASKVFFKALYEHKEETK